MRRYMNSVIGRLDWDACDDCTHYDYDDDGCECERSNHGGVPTSVDGDFVYCDLYVMRKAEDDE